MGGNQPNLAAFAITTAYSAISYTPVMVTIILALFFGQLLADVLIESLSRPATALMQKIVTAAPVAARTSAVFVAMTETGILTVFVIQLAGSNLDCFPHDKSNNLDSFCHGESRNLLPLGEQ